MLIACKTRDLASSLLVAVVTTATHIQIRKQNDRTPGTRSRTALLGHQIAPRLAGGASSSIAVSVYATSVNVRKRWRTGLKYSTGCSNGQIMGKTTAISPINVNTY